MPLKLANLEDTARLRRELPEPSERRRRRHEARIGVKEMAGVCGVSEASILAWEAGRTTPRGENLTAYSLALRALRSTE